MCQFAQVAEVSLGKNVKHWTCAVMHASFGLLWGFLWVFMFVCAVWFGVFCVCMCACMYTKTQYFQESTFYS